MSAIGALTPIASSQTSPDFRVEILNDNLSEHAEFFDAILTGVSVLTGGGAQPPLSAQERSRIQFAPERAQVEIIDTDSKPITSYIGF